MRTGYHLLGVVEVLLHVDQFLLLLLGRVLSCLLLLLLILSIQTLCILLVLVNQMWLSSERRKATYEGIDNIIVTDVRIDDVLALH